ncbi:MFS transporter [Candidatus Aalborgicola defluviihabitans]|uniref:MFS transporter n=1 Tax=Candidatus Aalborgicola defluviihabitans TaxID=3386187 RepID=UPI001D2D5BF6|nr:MFS transporter [Burkholderiales bacterium]MBK6569020.1 MFS transporter [Burkholderiales bacterium]MBK7313830.1 MFS transporter [Burkholderiales bacterium]
MRLPNLLATKNGRLMAFFLLYVTEGIPLGFAATAVATRLRRLDVGPAEIGAFVGSFYLPWAFKWAFGPVIDVFSSERLGRRRGWILFTQVAMALTLLSTVMLDLPAQLGLFTIILLVHNTFGAMQDVAIDALACSTLQENERGVANGMMFAGATIGSMVGGSGVMFLSGYTGFQPTFFFVAACILAVTAFVVLPMQEAPGPVRERVAGSKLAQAGREMRVFAIDSFRSFLGSSGAFGGLLFALLPAGAMCLGLALQSNLAVELGMDDDQVAALNFYSSILGAAFCVLGGYLSDRWGRRRTLLVYMALMSVPVFYLMNELTRYGWIMPVSTTVANRPQVPAALLTAFWIATLAYSVFQGLMYGARSAIMMDVTNPAVAATQFTAYMALMNLAISYSATWQGIAIEAWGYPTTMLVDGIFGLACLLVLPWLKRDSDAAAVEAGQSGSAAGFADALGPKRARRLATGLGLLCLAWVPSSIWSEVFGAGKPIVGTLFTVIFIASALFLLAGRAVLGDAGGRTARLGVWVAPLLILLYVRYYLDVIASWLPAGVDTASFVAGVNNTMLGVAVLAGVLLLQLGAQPWKQMEVGAR